MIGILLFGVNVTSSQPAPLERFDAYVADAVRTWEVPGLAIAVVKDGQVIFAKGYGARKLGRPESVDEHTLFAIGSTTKAMTAAALGMLVDEGRLQWDDPVIEHLPEFQLQDPYVTREVTVRDLLTHRAGLGNADFLWYGQDNSRREILRRLRYLEPQTSLRSHFAYQNIMYTAAIVGPEEFYPTARLTQPHWTTYGLGWFQHDYQGRAVDFHTGSIDGMVAIIGLIRDERLGVSVLANLDHAEIRHALVYRVFDLYGSGPARDWSAELRKLYGEIRGEAEAKQKETESQRVSGTQPSLPLEKYAGTYSHPLYGTVLITINSQGQHQLMARYGPGFVGELEHWHYDTFRAHWEAKWRDKSYVSFILDSMGNPTTLVFRDWVLKRVEPTETEQKQ